MKLRIVTPLSMIVDDDDVTAVRAEDDSGSFGILPGFADFLTSLAVSVVTWQRTKGARRFAAVRRGVLTVTAGREVLIATREAIVGQDFATLDTAVLDRFRADAEAERTERTQSTRLQLTAIREIMRHLRSGGVRDAGNLA